MQIVRGKPLKPLLKGYNIMRKRSVHFQLWLSEKEVEKLTKLAKESGYSRTAYLPRYFEK